MKTIVRAISCLSMALAALVATDAQSSTVYNWSGFYKDTGMAQFPAMAGAYIGTKYTLYTGSENFSTGPGKVNTFDSGGVTATFTTPTNDISVDFFAALIALSGGHVNKFFLGTDSAHVYLFDGTTFTNITPTAAAFSGNRGVYSGAEYSNRIFIGTGGSAGSAQVWAYDGTNWTQQSLPGFPTDNYYAWCMTVFNNALYLGTVDYSHAAQLWKYDGTSWSQVNIPGFSSNNYAVASIAVFNNRLYIGTSNTLGSGAEIWSTDGSSWTKLTGFGRNDAATAMAVFNGTLFIGTTNYATNAVGQLWAYDGASLTQVTAPGSFGSAGNSGIVSLTGTNDTLYAGTYNNTGAEIWTVTAGSSNSTAPTYPGALTGLWWNPNESGWGIHFTQRGSTVFAAWYTYDASGNPKWYVASDCVGLTGTSGTCTGSLYEVDGPRFFGTTFTPITSGQVSTAGSLSVTFSDANNGSMTYSVGSISRTVSIVREPVALGTLVPSVDYTDLWWNPNESGWGMAMAQQNANIFLAWYVYDSNGKPVWYVAPNCAVTGSACAGTVYSTTGPPLGTGFDPHQVQVTTAGTISVNFTDANNATLTYTVNGVAGTKSITRQLF